MYDVNYFIKKFEAIPEGKWCIGIQQNELGQRCAFGHCMPVDAIAKPSEVFGHTTPEGVSLGDLFYEGIGISPAEANNGCVTNYQQSTPKQRVLAALYDIQKKQQPKYQDITSELATEACLVKHDMADSGIKQYS